VVFIKKKMGVRFSIKEIKFVSDLPHRWFSPGPSVSSTNRTDRHDITKILLKVAINTIKQTNKQKHTKNRIFMNLKSHETDMMFTQRLFCQILN